MPHIFNVVDDIKRTMFPNGDVVIDVFYRPTAEEQNRWIVYISIPNGEHPCKVEFLIDDEDVLGSILRHGSVSRRVISNIMDAILERM